jgi:dienelactone hydrolase
MSRVGWTDVEKTVMQPPSHSFRLTGIALGLFLPASVLRADAPVQILAVEPAATKYNRDLRLYSQGYPARFHVTVANQTEKPCKGTLAAEVVGHLGTVYGLAPPTLELAPREERTVSLAWAYPRPITYEGIARGPVTVAGATWGHELNVAWRDTGGRAVSRGRTVFFVDQHGNSAEVGKGLAGAESLTPTQAFALRYSGYLSNPAFVPVASPAEFTMTVADGRVSGWKRGTAPSGFLTYLAKPGEGAAPSQAAVIVKNETLRLRQVWLLDPADAGGPSARRLYHLADRARYTFEVPAASREATLVLEMAKGSPGPPRLALEEMAARGEKQYGKFRPLLTDEAGKPVTSPAQWAERRKQLRGAIRKALGSALEEKPVPLDPMLVSSEQVPPQAYANGLAGSYTRQKVSLRIREGERINVWLFLPPGIGPFPAVLACHQTVAEGKDEPAGLGGYHDRLNFAPFLASRGFVVLAMDTFGAGERIYPGMKRSYDTSGMEAKDPNWSLMGQTAHDHMRVLDYLETLPFVDSRRIGAIGHSLGSESITALMALDDRVAAAGWSCGFTLMRTLDNAADIYTYRGHRILTGNFRKYLEAPAKDRKLPFDFDDCIALWAPRPVFMNGVSQELWPNAAQVAQAAQALRQVYRFYGADERLYVRYSDLNHSFPHEIQEDAFDWLDYWLKGPHGAAGRR